MHPVLAKLSAANRSALLGHPLYVKLLEPRRTLLLDEVIKVRASLDSEDNLDAFGDQDQRAADGAELKVALSSALTILSRHRLIGVDMIEGLADHRRGSMSEAMRELNAAQKTMSRMLRILDGLPPRLDPSAAMPPPWLNWDDYEPEDPPEYPWRPRDKREASLLHSALKDFGVKVSRTTADAEKPDSGLALLGLLADPPASAESMRKRLRR
jgi:hypothetical protein